MIRTESCFVSCRIMTFGILHVAGFVGAMVESLRVTEFMDGNFEQLVGNVLPFEPEGRRHTSLPGAGTKPEHPPVWMFIFCAGDILYGEAYGHLSLFRGAFQQINQGISPVTSAFCKVCCFWKRD